MYIQKLVAFLLEMIDGNFSFIRSNSNLFLNFIAYKRYGYKADNLNKSLKNYLELLFPYFLKRRVS